jgi:hypothetical protein
VLVSNPSSQKVTSSAAFSSGAGNNDNSNIYDGTGNGGSDKYSKSMHCQYGFSAPISNTKQTATMEAGKAFPTSLNG